MKITKEHDKDGNPVFKTGNVRATLHQYNPDFFLAFGNPCHVDGRYGMVAIIDGGTNIPRDLDCNDDNINGFLRDFRGAELTLIANKAAINSDTRGYWLDLSTSDVDAIHKISRIKEGQSVQIKSDINLWAHYWLGIDTEVKSDWDIKHNPEVMQ